MGFWSFFHPTSSEHSGKEEVKLEIGEDIRQSEEYGKYMERIGWKNVKIGKSGYQMFVRPLGIMGGVAKIQRTRLPLPWERIDEILAGYRVVLTKLEPLNCDYSDDDLARAGFGREKDPLRATRTRRIDLAPNPEVIMTGFKRARSWINKLRQEKYEVKIGDFDQFFRIWKQATKIQNIWSSSKKDYDSLWQSFGKKAFCVMVENSCGCMVLMHDRAAYYYYGAALPVAKENSWPYLVVWEAMLEAKRRGAIVWDWEGVYDPRYPNPRWKGFTQFKNTFGGEDVWLPGSFGKHSWGNLWRYSAPGRSR